MLPLRSKNILPFCPKQHSVTSFYWLWINCDAHVRYSQTCSQWQSKESQYFLKLSKALRCPSMKTHQQFAFVFLQSVILWSLWHQTQSQNPSQDYRDYLAVGGLKLVAKVGCFKYMFLCLDPLFSFRPTPPPICQPFRCPPTDALAWSSYMIIICEYYGYSLKW